MGRGKVKPLHGNLELNGSPGTKNLDSIIFSADLII
jgi:hypothetical protein